MADRTLRPIDQIKRGDLVLSRSGTSTTLVPDVVVANHTSRTSTTITLHLSNGEVLAMSPRQPVVLHNGTIASALAVATPAYGSIPRPVRLRTSDGTDVRVVASHVSHIPRAVHWLQTQHNGTVFMRDIETTTNPEDKEQPIDPEDAARSQGD